MANGVVFQDSLDCILIPNSMVGQTLHKVYQGAVSRTILQGKDH